MVQTPTNNETFFGIDISGVSQSFRNIRRQISKRHLLLEFGKNSLTFGESRLIKDEIIIEKLNKINLPEAAIDRGTPVDPEEMSKLISEIINQEKFWAHRASVVLPPEVALCKVIDLPSGLDINSARSYIIDSKAGFQFPIPLLQTDFDLVELGSSEKNTDMTRYFVFSVPKKLVDNLIQTLNKTGLELTRLEISIFSHARLLKNEISSLVDNDSLIVVDLTKECSYISCFGSNGPLLVEKISAIRDFPNIPDIDEGVKSIEEQVLKKDNYLELTHIDLKVLINELKSRIDNFKSENNKYKIKSIYLIGSNSSHPGIANLIEDNLSIKTRILRPEYVEGISDFPINNNIIRQSLGRLFGVSLLMIEDFSFNNENSLSIKFFKDNQSKDKANNIQSIHINNSEIKSPKSKDSEVDFLETINNEKKSENIDLENTQDQEKEELELPSIKDKKIDIDKEEKQNVIAVEEIKEDQSYERKDLENTQDQEKEELEWPSIKDKNIDLEIKEKEGKINKDQKKNKLNDVQINDFNMPDL